MYCSSRSSLVDASSIQMCTQRHVLRRACFDQLGPERLGFCPKCTPTLWFYELLSGVPFLALHTVCIYHTCLLLIVLCHYRGPVDIVSLIKVCANEMVLLTLTHFPRVWEAADETAQVLEFLPCMWETQVGFMAPAFGLAPP